MSVKEKINRFKEKFGICEIVYKVVLEDHQSKRKGIYPTNLKIDMRQVIPALKYAGYDFDKNLLTHLFGSKEKTGSHSVKKLRDALTHSVNQRAIQELIDREEELCGYMDQFLLKIREYDQKS